MMLNYDTPLLYLQFDFRERRVPVLTGWQKNTRETDELWMLIWARELDAVTNIENCWLTSSPRIPIFLMNHRFAIGDLKYCSTLMDCYDTYFIEQEAGQWCRWLNYLRIQHMMKRANEMDYNIMVRESHAWGVLTLYWSSPVSHR